MNPILVIGGGIAGVTAAVELAEAGKEVILVEKEPYLGGNVVKMHNYFPKLCPPACGMEINFRRIRNNRRIRVMTKSELIRVSGKQGKMKAFIRSAPRLVNDLCTACGDCVGACPEERPDAFNYDFGTTRAIYRNHPLAYPQKYEIDTTYCKGTVCNKCVETCSYDAIDLLAEPEEEELEIHSVITATGWQHYDPGAIAGLNYSGSKDIVTNVEFERLLSVSGPGEGKLVRPSDGKVPSSIAFVQCAGSRDRNHLSYCSAVCCSASLKHALNITELLPDTKVTIYYIDLRVTGRNEDFLVRVENAKQVRLVKGKVGAVAVDAAGEGLIVEAEDIASRRKERKLFDMVVLATGIVPGNGVPGMQKNEMGFYTAVQADGLYAAGCATRPQDVSSTVKEVTGVALRAMQ
jgi:quinone-modifying oxidoreductase subunit QmoA